MPLWVENNYELIAVSLKLSHLRRGLASVIYFSYSNALIILKDVVRRD